MRWTSGCGAVCKLFWRRGAAFLVVLATLFLSASAPEKRLSIYSTAANYSLPVVQRHGRDYVGLLELLDPLGTVSVKTEGSRWRMHYDNVLGEFIAGQSRARVQGRDADLGAAFLLENGRGLVPVTSLNSLLPRFLGGPVTFHEESGRLFVGSVATHFTAEVTPANPLQLVFHFTSPVNPSVASEPGKLHLTFSREPLVAPASSTLTFSSKAIPSATYSEANGAAEITVATSIPLAASFGADGRTVTLAPASSALPASKTTSPAASPATPSASTMASQPSTTSAAPAGPGARRYFAIVDASHGGNDPGEVFSNVLVEKDITVELARRLRQELQNRGISTLVLRDSDANLGLDDRAFFANNAHAAIYIAFHAASSGHGVRVYTALLPYEGEDDGPFRSWTRAQFAAIPISQTAAASVAAELKKQQVAVRTLEAPLRPLNNVVMAAIAVEVASQGSDISQLTAPEYQQLIASSVANGVAAIRDKLGAAP